MHDPDTRVTRWYRRLLLLFPFEFRRDYGSEMSGVFAEQHDERTRRSPSQRPRLRL